ncbi:DUF1573 domain-containing protein [Pseudofulvibacter geojedonensis]|uniref:DUF1573 domain-containing protein n=1 Tax=Pseudofulvibacter geojedonensis TaxID=1123758 RepID=A0ABW3I521_9FLAO
MKKLLLGLFFSVFSLAIFAQEAKIEFKKETIDYGKIENGSDGIRTFEFTNIGDAPLVISNVKSSCGCTVPKKPTAPIAPGENGVIEVKYDTKRTGFIRKTITVTSNATNVKGGLSYLKIKGEIKKPDTQSVLEKKQKSIMEQ